MKQIFSLVAGILCWSTGIIALGSVWPTPVLAQNATIAAVVNGQLITEADAESRARLLALYLSLPLTSDVLPRLKPQVT